MVVPLDRRESVSPQEVATDTVRAGSRMRIITEPGGGDDGNERSKPVEWRADWAMRKCKLALNLSRGDCGGSYGDGVIILCAAISALAAEAWPSRVRDKKRFV